MALHATAGRRYENPRSEMLAENVHMSLLQKQYMYFNWRICTKLTAPPKIAMYAFNERAFICYIKTGLIFYETISIVLFIYFYS